MNRSLAVALALFAAAAAILVVDSAWVVEARVDEREESGAWRTVAGPSLPTPGYGGAYSRTPIEISRNGSATFRVVILNERPLALRENVTAGFEAYGPFGASERGVLAGDVDAPAFGEANLTFTLPGSAVAGGFGREPRPVEPAPAGTSTSGGLVVHVGARTYRFNLEFLVIP